LVINTIDNEVYVNSLRPGSTFYKKFFTPYSLGTYNIDKIFICIECGSIHRCGDDCNMAEINTESSYTCSMTGIVVKAAEFAQDWKAELSNKKIWSNSDILKEIDHELTIYTKHVVINGIVREKKFIPRSNDKVIHSCKPYEFSYSMALHRYKHFFHDLFFGSFRQKLDNDRHLANKQEIHKKLNSYITNKKYHTYFYNSCFTLLLVDLYIYIYIDVILDDLYRCYVFIILVMY
jgi:hypothetical protein